MVIKARRIPAAKNTEYASWSFPSVSDGRVIKAQKARAFKRVPAETESAVVAKPAQAMKQSMSEQVVRNIKAGKYVQGVSARELESIVVESAREGREAGYAEGYRKGHAKGVADGHAEGLAAGQGIVEDGARRLQLLLNALNDPIAEQEQDIRTALVDAVTRIAIEVVRRELATRPDVIEGLVREAVGAMPAGARNLSVHISPADLKLLEEAGMQFDEQWRVEADPTLDAGSCRVEQGDSLVNFSQSERMQAIIKQFLDGAAAQGDD